LHCTTIIVRWTEENSLADLRLENHSRVCIIGGGPAGSFAALQLLRLSKLNNLHLEVIIFEPRNFSRPGPSGCNRCAGILSSHLWSNLSELSISIPEEIVQADLQSYNIHFDHQSIHLNRPDPSRRIISVYRGGGPRLVQGDPEASFDQFLLSQAVRRGAVQVPHRVRDVQWEGQPVLSTATEIFRANLLVLAIGINSRSPMGIGYNYRPPKTEVMAQDEVIRPTGWDSGEVNAYFRQPPGLRFGAIIPKGRYLNISLLGKGFTRNTVNEFIIAQNLTYLLQQDTPNSLCGCNPRISVSTAHHYYGDRWVAVGDAAVTRLYKDGIGSAYSTSRQAMSVAMQVGISANAFHKFYAPACHSIDADNFYGLLLYRLWNFILISPWILNIWKAAVQWEMSQPTHERRHTNILWGMLTGDEPYRQLFYRAINLIALLRLGYRMSTRRRGS
jgi:flavin-dependent dehydrogenase